MDRMKKVWTAVLLAAVLGGCTFMEKPIVSRRKPGPPVQRTYAVALKTVSVNNANLAYMEAGTDGPWVVLIHGGVLPMSTWQSILINPFSDLGVFITSGMPLSQSMLHAGALATADSWNYNLQALADAGFRVLALDLPGFGASDKPDLKYKVEDFVSYVDGFLKAKGVVKPMLVGHGLGGEIAIAYTLAHPDQVDRLVLVDSFGSFQKIRFLNLKPRAIVNAWGSEKAARINMFMPFYLKNLVRMKRAQDGALFQAVSPQIANSTPSASRKVIMSREGKSGEFLKAQAEYKMKYMRTADFVKEVHVVHKALPETHRRDFAPKLDQIKVPTLIIFGFFDPEVTLEQARFMQSRIPKSQLIIYQKSGHYPMVEESDRFNQDLIFFLTGKMVTK